MLNIAVVIFAFDRLQNCHELVLDVLKHADSSLKIILAMDGTSDKSHKVKQNEFIKKIENNRIHVIHQKKNRGLKKQIIQTIDDVSKKFDAFIILEEDLQITSTTLDFFLKRLNQYKSINNIWTINGYCHELMESDSDYLTQFVTSWGWATWSDRWQKLITDEDLIIERIRDWSLFNFDETYENRLLLYWNKYNVKKTWAIFWYSTVFINKGKALQIGRSQIINNGFNSGRNFKSGKDNRYARIKPLSVKNYESKLNLNQIDKSFKMYKKINHGVIFFIWRCYHWFRLMILKSI